MYTVYVWKQLSFNIWWCFEFVCAEFLLFIQFLRSVFLWIDCAQPRLLRLLRFGYKLNRQGPTKIRIPIFELFLFMQSQCFCCKILIFLSDLLVITEDDICFAWKTCQMELKFRNFARFMEDIYNLYFFCLIYKCLVHNFFELSKRKRKQWWTTIPPISTKRTITSKKKV